MAASESGPESTPNPKKAGESSVDRDKSQVVINALSMAFGTMTSRVLGLVREMALAAFFDKTITDAWAAAFRLPNLFRRLLGEGSLSVSFIPVFVEARLKEGTESRSRDLVNHFFTLLMVLLAVLTVLGIVYAEPVLDVLLDPAYKVIPGKFDLTVRFARIMFSFIFLMSTYAYFMAILNALGKYALAAMAPTLFNVAMIVFTLVPVSWFPVPGDGLAFGVLAGGFLQVIIMIPALHRLHYFPRFQWSLKNPDVTKVLKGMTGGLLGLGLVQITTLINMRFASQLGEGAISYIYWSDRLLELPLSLVSVSLGTALLPTLSAMWSRGESHRMSETAHFYLRLNLFVAVPAALGLYFLAEPIVELLFQRGHFNAEDTRVTAQVVQIYSLILIPTSAVRVLAPAYYAVKNTWYPAVVAAFGLLVHVLVAPWLMKFYGLSGLNFSSLVSSSLNFLFLLGSFGYFVTHFDWILLFKRVAAYFIPGVGMAITLSLYPIFRAFVVDNFLGKVLSLGACIGLSALVYFTLATALKLEENTATVQKFSNKLKNKLMARFRS